MVQEAPEIGLQVRFCCFQFSDLRRGNLDARCQVCDCSFLRKVCKMFSKVLNRLEFTDLTSCCLELSLSSSKKAKVLILSDSLDTRNSPLISPPPNLDLVCVVGVVIDSSRCCCESRRRQDR